MIELELMQFIFALCLKHDINNCPKKYDECVDRISENRLIENPELFCRNVLKNAILERSLGK